MGVDEVFDGFDAGTSVDNTTDEDYITEGVGADRLVNMPRVCFENIPVIPDMAAGVLAGPSDD